LLEKKRSVNLRYIGRLVDARADLETVVVVSTAASRGSRAGPITWQG
jgi:hypothetical protein